MTKYLISFPSSAMNLAEEDLQRASLDSHALIEEAKQAGVYVFGGGVNEAVTPVLVTADGRISEQTYPEVSITGGFAVFELPDRAAAQSWAQRMAAACGCAQELREFLYNPAS